MAIITNLMRDHQNHYASFSDYESDKKVIFESAGPAVFVFFLMISGGGSGGANAVERCILSGGGGGRQGGRLSGGISWWGYC